MTTIKGRRWWIFTVSALATGDADSLLEQREINPYLRNHLVGVADRARGIGQLIGHFTALQESGFSRFSRRGWQTAEHPLLGTVQWKTGADFRTTGRYFYLRLNGRMILSAWPEAGRKSTRVNWVAGEGNPNKEAVEAALGSW